MKPKTTLLSIYTIVFGNRAPMKFLLSLIMILPAAVRSADQKGEDLATIVIQSEMHAGYNPLNSRDEELNKAAVINSGLRLQYIMLHEVADPELKVCYALRVLDSQIATSRLLASENNKAAAENLTVLLQRQTELGKQLRAIQNRKAEGVGPSDRNQPTRPETSELPTNVVPILDRLNAWNKDAIDVCERPAAHPNVVDSGETSAFINVEKQQLATLGVAVKWNPQKIMYEVAVADEPLIPRQLNTLLGVQQYKIDECVRAAVSLQAMGPKAACQALLACANTNRGPDSDLRFFVLCRMLFTQRGTNDFRPPHDTHAYIVGDSPGWQFAPIQLVDGIPFLLAASWGGDAGGGRESGENYLHYCMSNCDWSTHTFREATSKQKSDALTNFLSFLSASKVKRPLTDFEKEFFSAQVE
jgi:hypothetical protein